MHLQSPKLECVVRLVATSNKLRKLVADDNTSTQLMLEPVTEEAAPAKAEVEAPVKKKPNLTPMKPLDKAWVVKKYIGTEAAHYIEWLERHKGAKKVAGFFAEQIIKKYDPDNRDYMNEPTVPVDFKGPTKRGVRYFQYILIWDLDPEEPEVILYLLPYNKQDFLSAHESRSWMRKLVSALVPTQVFARTEGVPAKVTEIADAIRRDDKSISDEAAYRMAWETYCSYTNPGYDGCTSKGKSERQSPKSEYSDE